MQIKITFIIIACLGIYSWSNAEIDHDYHEWKEKKQEWQQANGKYTFLKKIADLLHDINLYTELNEEHNLFQQEILYTYNLLREILNVPIVSSIDQINKEWLKEVETASKTFIDLEKEHIYGGYMPASISEQELLEEAKVTTGYKDKIDLFVQLMGGASTEGFISICYNPDLDQKLFTLYHELGHIAHKDFAIGSQIVKLGSIENYLAQKDIKFNTNQVKHYIELAKKTIDSSSNLGKHIQSVLAKHQIFWNPPKDNKEYIQTLLGRAKEKRADLFAIRQLYKQNKITPILTKIKKWGSSDYIIVEGNADEHPSDFERALYMAGFLIDKKVDINKALNDWEHKGMCLDTSKIITPGTRTLTKAKGVGTYDFLRAYETWQKKDSAYADWKWQQEQEMAFGKY